MNLAPYRKTIAGALLAGAAALGTAMLDGDITRAEAIAAAGALLLGGYGVWRPTNQQG